MENNEEQWRTEKMHQFRKNKEKQTPKHTETQTKHKNVPESFNKLAVKSSLVLAASIKRCFCSTSELKQILCLAILVAQTAMPGHEYIRHEA